MVSEALTDVIKRAESLTPEERLQLIAHLAEISRSTLPASRPRRRWQDLRGALEYPALGEDAQQWVSRTRREGDEAREHQWRRAR